MGMISRGGGVACGIRYGGGAPRNIRMRGGGIAAPIRLHQHHARSGVSAGGGGGNTCVVRLREGETICHYGTGGNGRGGDGAVGGSDRRCSIQRVGGGGQASFVSDNRFLLQRGGSAGDKLFLHCGEGLSLCIITRAGGDLVHAVLHQLCSIGGKLHG